MVKGISKRVIVVRSPDPRFFEQAVFFMKEDALHADGVTAEQVVDEAQRVAAGYVRRSRAEQAPEKGLHLPGWGWFLLGAAAAAAVCLLGFFLL